MIRMDIRAALLLLLTVLIALGLLTFVNFPGLAASLMGAAPSMMTATR